MKRKLVWILAAVLLVAGCGIYSFSGTSIQPDVQTVTINFFEYRALRVNPMLSTDLTEALKTQFRRLTRLAQREVDGDIEISGEVVGYDVRASSVSADEVAAQNRLTVTVKIKFENKKYPEDNFDNKTFSAYADFDATLLLDAVESRLCKEIIDKLVEDIFNATVAQW